MRVALGRVNYSQFYGVYDDICTERDILIPYSLLVLSTEINKLGIEVKIFDAEVHLWSEERLAQEIYKWKPDFVGMTATTTDIMLTMKVCELLKDLNSSVVTILGGCHPTVCFKDITNNKIDFIVKGRGEKAIREIINNKCPNRLVEFTDEYDANYVDYSLIDLSDYTFTDPVKGRVVAVSVMTMYGCPFSCGFCFHNKKTSYKSVIDFIDEVKFLYLDKGVRYFYVYDDTFLLNKKRAFMILQELEQFKDAHFQCLVRANLIDKEAAIQLKEAHFVRVSMGLESGSDMLLKKVSKSVTVKDGENACRELYKVGIETRASFILGLPYETKKTIRQTIDYANRIDLYHANFNILTPYPGTDVYYMTLRGEGLKFVNKEYETDWSSYRRWGKSVIETDDLTYKDLEKSQIDAQVEFYARQKIFEYYYKLFENGNKSKYFYRPLNFAWKNKFGQDISFWKELV